MCYHPGVLIHNGSGRKIRDFLLHFSGGLMWVSMLIGFTDIWTISVKPIILNRLMTIFSKTGDVINFPQIKHGVVTLGHCACKVWGVENQTSPC